MPENSNHPCFCPSLFLPAGTGIIAEEVEMMERLQKVMANRGVASRRKSEELILMGKVKVNGQTVRELGFKVDPEKDVIEVDGQVLKPEKRVYILLYKPAGVITSVTDPFNRKVVLDLLKDVRERVYPVGRLDYETEGLLLLTNDGELAHRIMHPRYEIEKEYEALVRGRPSEEKLELLRKGIKLEDGLTAPARVTLLKTNKEGNSWLRLVIHEGRNRQVRRMCKAIQHPVIYLKRIRLGFLTLKGLKKGMYRYLTEEEVRKLKKMVGMEP